MSSVIEQIHSNTVDNAASYKYTRYETSHPSSGFKGTTDIMIDYIRNAHALVTVWFYTSTAPT